jgi:hypothetical protein
LDVPLLDSLGFPNHVVVRYDSSVVDSKEKTLEKARDLEGVRGVQNASASRTCVGMVLVSCGTQEEQQQLIDDLVTDPTVESAVNSSYRIHQCERQRILAEDEAPLLIAGPGVLSNESFRITADTGLDVGDMEKIDGDVDVLADKVADHAHDSEVLEAEADATGRDAQDVHAVAQPVLSGSGSNGTVLGSLTVPLKLASFRPGHRGRLVRCSMGKPWLALCRALSVAVAKGLLPGGTSEEAASLVTVELMFASAVGPIVRAPEKKEPRRSGARHLKVMVNFEVVPVPGNATENLTESIYARLKVLSRGGRASEHFDTALDNELEALGMGALPDEERSHFGRPRRGTALDSLDRTSGPGADGMDNTSLVLCVAMCFVFCVVFGAVVVAAFLPSTI